MKKLLLLSVLCVFGAFGQSQSVTITVHPVSGNGPTNLVSNALPLKPGVLFDARNVRVLDGSTELRVAARVLATWPQDRSVRSVLLQFSAPFTTSNKAFTVQIGAPRGSVDLPFTPVTWTMPTRVFTVSADYLTQSLVMWEQLPLGKTGFPDWDAKQTANYGRIETVGTAACVREDQYYDAITTTFQLYVRTGQLKYLLNGRKWAIHHRRDQIYLSGSSVGRPRCSGNYINNTRYTFPQGLVADYMFFGDEESRRVSGLVVDNFYMPHSESWYYKVPNTRGFWTEREAAFSLIGILAHYEATGNTTYLNKVRDRVASLRRMQVDNARRAWVHNLYDHDPSEGCRTTDYGSSPWMSGLLLEAIVKYHKLTGDPVARESILMAVDDIRARYVATGAYSGRSFIYLGCSAYRDGAPDLDNLIAHAFGYAYKLTGNTAYRSFGTAVFNTAVQSGYTGGAKQYNQQFRSSGHFPAYISQAPQTTTTEPAPITEPAPAPAPEPVPTPSSDTTPPAIAFTAPSANQTITGIVTITVSATDNVGVAGVQFLFNNIPYGAEVTKAPYSIVIHTGTLAPGPRTITARARDAAGNQTTTWLRVNVSNSTFTTLRMNAGGPQWMDASSTYWPADFGYSDGAARSTTASISNALVPEVYKSQRYGSSFAYDFYVPNGDYYLTISLAEIDPNATRSGQRQFNVDVNGSRMLTNLDVFAASGGRNIAHDVRLPVRATNGNIHVVFRGVTSTAICNAVRITTR